MTKTYLEITREMRYLGYDYKGVQFVDNDDQLISCHEGNKQVSQVYVRHDCPLSMRYFEQHNMWQKDKVLFHNETVFVPKSN